MDPFVRRFLKHYSIAEDAPIALQTTLRHTTL
jgi:hypothetical protein